MLYDFLVMQYYMTLIPQNSEGEILVNFKRNKGTIYAKLVREDKLREASRWGDGVIVIFSKIMVLIKDYFYLLILILIFY